MARTVTPDPNQLVSVKWRDTGADVQLPYRLLNTGNRAAQERWLIADGQLADPSAPLVELQESAEIVSAVIDTAALSAVEARIQALEQRPEAQELPTHDSLERLAISVQRAAISKTEIVAVADEATARIDAVASDIEVRQNGFAALIDGGMRQMADAISSFMEKGSVYLADLGQNFALFLDEQGQVVVRVATDVATKVATAVARAEAAKHWGSSLTFCTEDPSKTDHASFAKRWYGRDFLIEGDGCGQTTESGLIIWRFAGGAWRKSSELVEKTALVNQQLAVQDNSSHTLAVLPAPTASGEGGSADNLKTVVQSQGGWNRLASLDRYAAVGYSGIAKSALISVEATIIDGPHSGRTGSWLISAALDKVGVCNVEIYAELGEIPRDFGVAPSVEIRTTGTFQKPPAIIGTFPAAPSIECFCNGWLEPASGWAGRPTQMLLKGWIKWNTDSRIVGVTPAWTLQQEYN